MAARRHALSGARGDGGWRLTMLPKSLRPFPARAAAYSDGTKLRGHADVLCSALKEVDLRRFLHRRAN